MLVAPGVAGSDRLGWVLMITSAANIGWPDDVSLAECYRECGLPVPSMVRTAKIATVDLASATRLGGLPDRALAEVRRILEQRLEMREHPPPHP